MTRAPVDHAHIERKRREIARIGGGHTYSATAVDAAIAQSNRAGRRISKREGERIHALLRGWRK